MVRFIVACMALSQVPEGNPLAQAARAAKGAPVAAAASDGGSKDAGVAGKDAGVPSPTAESTTPKAALTPEVKTLVDRVQAFYEHTKDFKADFSQAYTYKAFKRTQVSTGTVTFKKPALMRWEYEKPAPKTFVLAGERVYAYDPEAKLLTRAAMSTNSLSASVTFLWGQGKLADEFSIARKDCATCAGTLLELTPLVPDPRFQRVLLEVDPATAQVVKSTVIDPDGSQNAITFAKLTTNVGVDEAFFKLTPPPGTQVQDFAGNAPAAAPSVAPKTAKP